MNVILLKKIIFDIFIFMDLSIDYECRGSTTNRHALLYNTTKIKKICDLVLLLSFQIKTVCNQEWSLTTNSYNILMVGLFLKCNGGCINFMWLHHFFGKYHRFTVPVFATRKAPCLLVVLKCGNSSESRNRYDSCLHYAISILNNHLFQCSRL